MPELPEVETIKRDLLLKIKGKRIVDVKILWDGILNIPPKDFIKKITGSEIVNIERRAKILIFTLSNNFAMLAHLKMTGQLIYASEMPNGGPAALLQNSLYKYARTIFIFQGKSALVFNDLRKFAYIKLIPQDKIPEEIEKKFGPEPLSADFTLEKFKKIILENPRKKIKQLLMDQSMIAGIGNIYADEICFYAKVLTTKPAKELTEEQTRKLYNGIKKILPMAIEQRGTSIDTYVDASGKKGSFVKKLKVYDREGEKCFRCGGTVKRIKLGGRSSYFCPSCQK